MRNFKILFILTIFCASIVQPAVAQLTKQRDVKPFVPSIMGMGNGFSAQAHGIYSLWTNPAGLHNNEKYIQHDLNNTEITSFALSVRGQPYPSDIYDTFKGLWTLFDGVTNNANNAIRQLTKTGMKIGGSIYGGFVHQSRTWGAIGASLMSTTESFIYSYSSILATNVEIINQTEIAMGYAYQFKFNNIILNLGATVRPFFRSYNLLRSSSSLNVLLGEGEVKHVLNDIIGLQGFGIGADVGLQFEWRGIMLGVDVRDIFTPLFYQKVNPLNYFTLKQSRPAPLTFEYYIPLQLDIGVGYKFMPTGNLGNYFNALVYVQVTDPLDNTNVSTFRSQDFVKHLNMGIEMRILPPFFQIQIGLNQGYPTFGIGADIWLLDINFVVYVQEEGLKIRERTSPGLGLEIAFRW